MNQMLKYVIAMLPAVGMAILCGCTIGDPIEPMYEGREIELPTELFATTADTTTTEVTTTTLSPYTPLVDDDIRQMVAEMTVRERVAQMMIVSCSDQFTAQYVSEQGAGGVCLFAGPFEWKTAEEVRAMTKGFQDAAKIPMLIAVDEEGGEVNRISLNPNLRRTSFQSPRALYEQGGLNLIKSDAREKSDLLLNLGVNVNFAPVCDVPLTEFDFIYWRSFSNNAKETSEYVDSVVSVMKQQGIGSTLKHFPGYGGSTDTHWGMAWDNRAYSEFETRDFLPFKAGIEAGADSVMISHNIVECMDADKPASLSPAVHKILREQLDFRGVVMTDDLGMGAISTFTKDRNPAVAAISAGNDMIIYWDFESAVNAVTEAVHAYKINITQVDNSVYRILMWKRKLGLL